MDQQRPFSSLLHNWISLAGIPLALFGFVVGLTLILIDLNTPFASPYLGIFTYMVVPVILVAGLCLTLVGVLRERRRRRTGRASRPGLPIIDLNNRRQFGAFIAVVVISLLFLALSAVGAYRAYHFTESVTFCGLTCHEVMEPEHTAYRDSPHASVLCAACHIGSGADWFVKSKLSGVRQVFATLANSYHRPIDTPLANLRPAEETCHTCHWPEKFFGAVGRSWTYYKSDDANSPWTIRMLIKVGGGDPRHGPVQGIHWHMNIANKVEYIAADGDRQVIPWVRVTDAAGKVTIYQTQEEQQRLGAEAVAAAQVRRMDCMDCHNRPSHQYAAPSRALDLQLALGNIDPALPAIKRNAAELLVGQYATRDDALASIRQGLLEAYPEGGDAVERSVAEVQRIYARSLFPRMKVDWRVYPDHIGHMITPGCFRCHDGQHVSEDGQPVTRECDACHTILAQGPGSETGDMSARGLSFQHPDEDVGDAWQEMRCDECHTGAPY